MAHELLRDADDCLAVGDGPKLPQGFSIQREALYHELAVVGFPQRRGVAALRVLAQETLAAWIFLPQRSCPNLLEPWFDARSVAGVRQGPGARSSGSGANDLVLQWRVPHRPLAGRLVGCGEDDEHLAGVALEAVGHLLETGAVPGGMPGPAGRGHAGQARRRDRPRRPGRRSRR